MNNKHITFDKHIKFSFRYYKLQDCPVCWQVALKIFVLILISAFIR